jgi:peptidoglycan/xylan/chitin deacetylase (PgdA/CDA1 family)
MPFWRQLLLTMYYHASRPVRACNDWRQRSTDCLPILVLFYHRIADDGANPWTMPNATFVRQMEWLRERFDFISLDDAQQRICRGYNPQPCISVTFDDGYADNCEQAIPWLTKNRIPCTYFVTLENVMNDEPFAHDQVRGHRLAPNTLEQLRTMVAAGVEIGCHAYTHSDLGRIADPRRLRYEICTAKDDLEAAIGQPVRYFAFPFGRYENLNATAFNLAKQAGYAGVCSAYGGYNFPGDDPFHIQRIPADNAMIRLKNWVTQDPRRLCTKRFEYQGTGDGGSAAWGEESTVDANCPEEMAEHK